MKRDDERERAEEQLLAMAIGADGGHDALDFEARVLARLAAEPAAPRVSTWRWLAAAGWLLGGTAAVVGVAVTMHREPARIFAQDPVAKAQEPQAPKVVRITDADLPKRADFQSAQSLFEAVHELAKAAALPVVVAVPAVEGPSGWSIRNVTPRQAIAALAREMGAHVEVFGAVLAIVPGVVPEEPTVTVQREATSVLTMFDLVAHTAGLNLVIDAKVSGQVAVDVKDWPARELLERLAQAVGAEVSGGGRILRIVPKATTAPPRVHFAFDRTECRKVFDAIGKIRGEPIEVDAGVQGQVSVRVRNLPATDVLEAIAAALGAEIVQDGKVARCRSKANVAPTPKQK